MNAVLQCLSHTDILAEYFVLDQYKVRFYGTSTHIYWWEVEKRLYCIIFMLLSKIRYLKKKTNTNPSSLYLIVVIE